MSESNQTPELKHVLSGYFNVEVNDINRLVNWLGESHEPNIALFIQQFKKQLREALDKPGIVTPIIYENWTDNDEFQTQEEVQRHLQNIWSACFD